MDNKRFRNQDPEVRQLILDFERMYASGESEYFDVDQLNIIIDYYLECYDIDMLTYAVDYARRLFPDSTDIELRYAHMLCAKEKYTEALQILRSMVRAEPDNTDVLYALGILYSAMDKPRQAIQYYLLAGKDGCELDMVYGNIGDEYLKLDNLGQSIYYYKKALSLNPQESRSILNLSHCYHVLDDDEEAIRYFRQFVEDTPYSADAWYVLGVAYARQGFTEHAEDAFKYAIAIDKSYFPAYTELATCYDEQNKVAEAVNTLHEALSHTDDAGYIYFCIAHCYYKRYNWVTAETYYTKALQEDPYYADARMYKALCLMQMDDLTSAESNILRAIDLNPQNIEYLMVLVRIQILQEQFDLAQKTLYDIFAQDVDMAELYAMDIVDDFIQGSFWNEALLILQVCREVLGEHVATLSRMIPCYVATHQYDKVTQTCTVLYMKDAAALDEALNEYPFLQKDPYVIDVLQHTKNMNRNKS